MLYHATTATVQSIVGKNVNFMSLTKVLHCLTQNVTCFYAKLFNSSSKMFAFAKKPFLNSRNCFNFSVFISICPPSSVIPAVCTKYMCICLQSIYIFVILFFHTWEGFLFCCSSCCFFSFFLLVKIVLLILTEEATFKANLWYFDFIIKTDSTQNEISGFLKQATHYCSVTLQNCFAANTMPHFGLCETFPFYPNFQCTHSDVFTSALVLLYILLAVNHLTPTGRNWSLLQEIILQKPAALQTVLSHPGLFI